MSEYSIDRKLLIELLDNTIECWNEEYSKHGNTRKTEAYMKNINQVKILLGEFVTVEDTEGGDD